MTESEHRPRAYDLDSVMESYQPSELIQILQHQREITDVQAFVENPLPQEIAKAHATDLEKLTRNTSIYDPPHELYFLNDRLLQQLRELRKHRDEQPVMDAIRLRRTVLAAQRILPLEVTIDTEQTQPKRSKPKSKKNPAA